MFAEREPVKVKVNTVLLLAVTVLLIITQVLPVVFCRYTVPTQAPVASALIEVVSIASLKVTTTVVIEEALAAAIGVTLTTVGAVVSAVLAVVNPVDWVSAAARALPAASLAAVVTLIL
ncbi:MAG: hypothetical protein A2600_00680 [Candidatus Lambdaproteobacteria bacterium RIFOXYD1_FULL_56_27]|uniref:Uncharacterized protein n=1 Tax=Candidatus Lambdaproteobacteria bacterium RIFOXYD2_FULL_56_26 TaxID=1817773 RepID=A0A1F6GLR2_9PROT|nr:MAG: hypothetical protein A2557_09840 [Candidatus Lambdaproteobacteria bacterium RIFOXYD2_FULL_56_26]OGH01441.1 MAG: hypothetical protein A2426_08625 [Candidatus Lambdaproteobacteria bacterium RIFOXYC1_FULL_56_13]OGH07072.1 MAG: hypothetical protein A2600_00680 [Candidatus Lambdaproteobacteria bacterium RIFOXYD1_FULL_56_27]